MKVSFNKSKISNEKIMKKEKYKFYEGYSKGNLKIGNCSPVRQTNQAN